MNLSGRGATRWLRALQVLFYLAFVFLWFKGNYPLFRPIPVPSGVPLAGLVLVTALRAAAKLKTSAARFKPKPGRDWAILAGILLLVVAVHVPFLVHNFGLMDSDEAIPALQGKHIAEGKRPAVFYYGALFQGSLPQHYYALLVRVFGYSVALVKLAALLAFCAFIAVQYVLLKKFLSREFAVLASLFYLLPFKHLVIAAFDVGSGFPVVFLLGAVIFSLTAKICGEGQDRWLATLGFVMGLAFWTHQIAIVFLLASGVFLALRYRAKIGRYLTLAAFVLIGMFPLIVSEVYWKFPIVRVLFGGESAWMVSRSKLANGGRLMLELVSAGPAWANVLFFAAFFAGLAVLAARSVRAKAVGMPALYVLYVLVFAAVYSLSASSADKIVRYLYVLYVVIPVALVAAVFWIKPAWPRRGAALILLAGIFAVNGGKDGVKYFHDIRMLDANLKAVTAAMAATGDRYWTSNYWISYLINAVSKEKFLVASNTVERYWPYRLEYDSEAKGRNRIFWRGNEPYHDPEEFQALLDKAGKKYAIARIDDWVLFTGIEGYVYMQNKFFPPPEIPDVTLAGVQVTDSGLLFRFGAKRPLSSGDFQLHVEIPGYCAPFAPIGPGAEFTVRVPYPPERNVRVRYYVTHLGMTLDTTVRETDVLLPAAPKTFARPPVEPLLGVGPRETATGKQWEVLAKAARFQVNRPAGEFSKISLGLYAPFNFADPFWHGDFAQDVEIFVNEMFFKKIRLADGRNSIVLTVRTPPFVAGANILTLKFKYAYVLSIKDHWKTSAFLEYLVVD